jgi:hypothetical protein
MSARQCPNCFAFLPPGQVVAYSYDLVCPSCQHPLEISALSRNLPAYAGLVAGAIVWWLASAHYSGQPGALGWVLPLLVRFTADLTLKPLDSIVFQYEAPPSHHP